MTEHRDMALRIDRHFSLRINREDERVMRVHLHDCPSCRDYYDRHLALSALVSGGHDAQTRLARGLGLRSRRSWSSLPTLPARLLVPIAAAISVLALSLMPEPESASLSQSFHARGAPSDASASVVRAYRIEGRKDSSLVADRIGALDELAFAYTNPKGRRFLYVLSRDETGAVYWYVPAWTDKDSDPIGMRVERTQEYREVPSAVSHHYRGNALSLYGLLTDRAIAVTEVEKILAEPHPDAIRAALPDAVLQKRSFRIERPQ